MRLEAEKCLARFTAVIMMFICFYNEDQNVLCLEDNNGTNKDKLGEVKSIGDQKIEKMYSLSMPRGMSYQTSSFLPQNKLNINGSLEFWNKSMTTLSKTIDEKATTVTQRGIFPRTIVPHSQRAMFTFKASIQSAFSWKSSALMNTRSASSSLFTSSTLSEATDPIKTKINQTEVLSRDSRELRRSIQVSDPLSTKKSLSSISRTVRQKLDIQSSIARSVIFPHEETSILNQAIISSTKASSQIRLFVDSTIVPNSYTISKNSNSAVRTSGIDPTTEPSSLRKSELSSTTSVKNSKLAYINSTTKRIDQEQGLITVISSSLLNQSVTTVIASSIPASTFQTRTSVNFTASVVKHPEMTSNRKGLTLILGKSSTFASSVTHTISARYSMAMALNTSQQTYIPSVSSNSVKKIYRQATSTSDASVKTDKLSPIAPSVEPTISSVFSTIRLSLRVGSKSNAAASSSFYKTKMSSTSELPHGISKASNVFTPIKPNRTALDYDSRRVRSSIDKSSIVTMTRPNRAKTYQFTRTLSTSVDTSVVIATSVKPSKSTTYSTMKNSELSTRKTVTASATGKPVTTSATRKPVTTSATGKPVTTGAADKPTTTLATMKPVSTPATRKPVTSSTTRKLVTTSATGKPVTTSETWRPVTTSATRRPTATTKTAIIPTTGTSRFTSPTQKQSTKSLLTTKLPFIGIPKVSTRIIAVFQSAIKVEFRVDFPGIKRANKLEIIVQQHDSSFTGSKNKLHTWYEVHYFEDYKHHPYVAKQFTDPKYTARVLFNFTIGNDKRCQERQVSTGYCNGPLDQGAYRFRLVYHVDGMVRKSKYSKIYSTAPAKPTPAIQTTGIDQNKVTIAVIGVLAVLLVVIIIVAVVLYRKKSSQRDAANTSDDPDCTLLSSLKRNSSSCYGRRVLGVGDSSLSLKNVSKGMSRPVHVKDFIAWVTRSQADSDFRFAEEFESIRDVGRDQSHEASDLPENRGKNRYTNVLAHDKTRVKLSYTDDEAGSDYINANYIHGFKHPRAYIAAQGPLPGTTDDFWRMIWEHDTHNIVMVTQCMERSRVKCHEYWPGTQPTAYGEITVSLLSEFSYPEWIEREFLLEGEGEGSRTVKHFQYTAWPDHGVPRTTSNILEFLQAVRSDVDPSHGPLVIHCSAGVGRTGTFIAIDTLTNRLQEEDTVDVYLTVCLMRMQRCNMVQTEDQYIFIHRAVVEYLRNQDPVSNFKGYSLLPKDEGNSKSSFDHLAPSDSLTANRDSGLALLLGEFETEHAKDAMETVA